MSDDASENTRSQFLQTLRGCGQTTDESLPLEKLVLTLAALDKPGRDMGRYIHHLQMLKDNVKQRFHDLRMAGAEDDVATRLAALKHVIHDDQGYDGDRDTYDDLCNADMMDVIDRRKGLPISLCILTLIVARAQGWDVAGINFPGHFVMRLAVGPQRVIFDPFDHFTILAAPQLRQMLKRSVGEHAELSAQYYADASNRDTVLRLQNNIKSRCIQAEDYDTALRIVERMQLFAPDDPRLLFDQGVLQAKLGHIREAIATLESFIAVSQDRATIQDARAFLMALKSGLN
jgi:regulator of sirC expression with transglutaminase-like and TPR domain